MKKILVTGATGYVARRLLPVLLESGYEVICCVRDKNRFDLSIYEDKPVSVIEIDLLDTNTLGRIPQDIDAAYYFVHAMSGDKDDFAKLDQTAASNFRQRIEKTAAKQVIYLSGISNEKHLSKHLSSRKNTEDELESKQYALTVLRAGIIVGSGSASFEIIRDLVEKLPVMITPRWLNTHTTPIAIANVVSFLNGVLLDARFYYQCYDIYGPEVLTYKQMLLIFAKVRGLKRKIMVLPVMTPRLSSYWLYFVTSVPYHLAKNLVDSMKSEVIPKENNLSKRLNIKLLDYETAIRKAFDKIEQNMVVSSWKDALNSDFLKTGLNNYIQVPANGCYTDKRSIKSDDVGLSVNKMFAIGGTAGWYYADWLWSFRGFLDKLVGGVGLRRGRRDPGKIYAGETLDFWRVIYANRQEKRLLLYAEMKLPGEAWLEFCIDNKGCVTQTATFRPLGLLGRLYWYSVLPFHAFIFKGMLSSIAKSKKQLA
jgi:uncharacterized protein YbjT (DUF2867 family)